MTTYLIIPGLGGSGENHWQTLFEKSGANFVRVQQDNWEAPQLDKWADKLDKTITKYNENEVVLVGHSMGCPTIARWAQKYQRKIKGALLVAPADLEKQEGLLSKVGLKEFPSQPLCFKSIVVASTNDPWASIDRSVTFASNWGSDFVSIGNAGHINSESGLGNWEFGLSLLKSI
jgi:uncharacterized protein